MHKRKAELESAARVDEEEEFDEFSAPRQEAASFGASEAAFGASGSSGSGTRVAFTGSEVPSRPKSSRHEATFSYPQVEIIFFLQLKTLVYRRRSKRQLSYQKVSKLWFAGEAGVGDKPG